MGTTRFCLFARGVGTAPGVAAASPGPGGLGRSGPQDSRGRALLPGGREGPRSSFTREGVGPRAPGLGVTADGAPREGGPRGGRLGIRSGRPGEAGGGRRGGGVPCRRGHTRERGCRHGPPLPDCMEIVAFSEPRVSPYGLPLRNPHLESKTSFYGFLFLSDGRGVGWGWWWLWQGEAGHLGGPSTRTPSLHTAHSFEPGPGTPCPFLSAPQSLPVSSLRLSLLLPELLGFGVQHPRVRGVTLLPLYSRGKRLHKEHRPGRGPDLIWRLSPLGSLFLGCWVPLCLPPQSSSRRGLEGGGR